MGKSDLYNDLVGRGLAREVEWKFATTFAGYSFVLLSTNRNHSGQLAFMHVRGAGKVVGTIEGDEQEEIARLHNESRKVARAKRKPFVVYLRDASRAPVIRTPPEQPSRPPPPPPPPVITTEVPSQQQLSPLSRFSISRSVLLLTPTLSRNSMQKSPRSPRSPHSALRRSPVGIESDSSKTTSSVSSRSDEEWELVREEEAKAEHLESETGHLRTISSHSPPILPPTLSLSPLTTMNPYFPSPVSQPPSPFAHPQMPLIPSPPTPERAPATPTPSPPAAAVVPAPSVPAASPPIPPTSNPNFEFERQRPTRAATISATRSPPYPTLTHSPSLSHSLSHSHSFTSSPSYHSLSQPIGLRPPPRSTSIKALSAEVQEVVRPTLPHSDSLAIWAASPPTRSPAGSTNALALAPSPPTPSSPVSPPTHLPVAQTQRQPQRSASLPQRASSPHPPNVQPRPTAYGPISHADGVCVHFIQGLDPRISARSNKDIYSEISNVIRECYGKTGDLRTADLKPKKRWWKL